MELLTEHIVSVARGMNDNATAIEYQPDESELVQNARVSVGGLELYRRDGSQRTNAATLNSGAQCYGAERFTTAAGQKQICGFWGGKFYYSTDEGATFTNPAAATGLTENYWNMVVMRSGATNYLICANGGANVFSWDGTNWASLSNWAAGVKLLAVHNGRLAGAGHDGIKVQFSAVNTPNTLSAPSGYIVQCNTHDGDNEITGLYQLGSVLMVWKRTSTGFIDGFGYQTLTVEVGPRGVSRSVGCIAFRTIQSIVRDLDESASAVIWLSERGLEYFSLGGAIRLLTRPLQEFMDSIAWNNIRTTPGLPDSLYWPKMNEYRCALPVSGTQNNWTIVYRPGSDRVPEALMLDSHTPATGGTLYVEDGYLHFSAAADRSPARTTNNGYLEVAAGGQPGLFLALDGDNYLGLATTTHDHAALFVADHGEESLAPWAAGYDGFVRRLEYGDTDNASSAGAAGSTINGRWITRSLAFQSPFHKKKAKRVRMLLRSPAQTTVYVAMRADGVEQATHGVIVPASAADMPKALKIRVGGKGLAQQVEMRFTGKLYISGLKVWAEKLYEAA